MSKAKKSAPPAAAPKAGDAAAVWMPIGDIHPWAENPRKNDSAVGGVAASLDAFGWGDVVVARKANGEIIAGHTRYKAALVRGDDVIPVRFLDLDEHRAHLLALAANKLAEVSKWDDAKIARALADYELQEMLLAGFDAEEVQKILGENNDVELEEVDVSEALGEEFWLSVRGPLPKQPDVLERLRSSLADVEGVDVQIGTTG